MAEFKITPQDTITFLQEYIDSINEEIDVLLEGKDLKKIIKAPQLRIKVLKRAPENPFAEKIKILESQLSEYEKKYDKINPLIESLESERSYYRKLLNEVSS
ncbi:hypothetical protein KKB99_04480 [bacterium]|nr:hypothetical protein [bacterium]MBU1025251.1 hypothetical protein [bacterium]